MENLLDIYSRPYNEDYPVVCFDERPCQLIGDILSPMPMKPKKIKKQDYQYERMGTCALLVALEAKRGYRLVETRQNRKKKDYTRFMQKRSKQYPR